MGVDMDPEAPSLNGLRRALSKARSTDALMNIRGSDATHKALPGSRSTTILGPLPQPLEEARPRRKAILRKPVSKHAKKFLKKDAALDEAMAALAKLQGVGALPENASGAGAATRAVFEQARLDELAKRAAAGPETSSPKLTPAERRHALHEQLEAKVKTLAAKLSAVRALQARVDASADPRLKERARVHQNATQGLELLEELAKAARRDACERAIRFREARDRAPDLPHFISILKDDGLSCLQNKQLAEADAKIQKYAKGWETRGAPAPRAAGGADAAPAFAHAPPSPLGSRYHTHVHAA